MISWPWFPTSFRNQVWRCKSIQIQIRRRRVFLFRKLISNQSTVLNGDLEGLETWWEKKFVKARWKTWTQKLRRFGCLGGLETWWEKKSWKQCGRLKRKNYVKSNDSGVLEAWRLDEKKIRESNVEDLNAKIAWKSTIQVAWNTCWAKNLVNFIDSCTHLSLDDKSKYYVKSTILVDWKTWLANFSSNQCCKYPIRTFYGKIMQRFYYKKVEFLYHECDFWEGCRCGNNLNKNHATSGSAWGQVWLIMEGQKSFHPWKVLDILWNAL